MDDPFELSSAIIDSGELKGSVNRISNKLSTLTSRISLIESFSNVAVIKAGSELTLLDTSSFITGLSVASEFSAHFVEPIRNIVYTHGHVDHVGGSGSFAKLKHLTKSDVQVIGHRRIPARFARYKEFNDYNLLINERQFGRFFNTEFSVGQKFSFLPDDVLEPTVTYEDKITVPLSSGQLQLFHALGETDDHTWAYYDEEGAIFCGDLFIWVFPNAGNPQKVQRYPREWANALKEMLSFEPEVFIPAHGLPIKSNSRIKKVLEDTIEALESLVSQSVELMNKGLELNEVLHRVKLDEKLLAKPWLLPLYDDPEFVVRNIWRLYGGWWDGNPATLKPSATEEFAREIADLAGGALNLAKRAMEIAQNDNIRLAVELCELSYRAGSNNFEIREICAKIYEKAMNQEPSLMAKGIYRSAKERFEN